MSTNTVYKLTDIVGFKQLLIDNNDDSETLKLCKTNVVTRNNQQYKVIRYDKNFLSIDLIPTNGLLRSVIIDANNNVVSFAPPKSIPFEKFVETNPVKNDSIVAEEFVEGTMINVFWDSTSGLSGAWELATRNSVGGEVSFYKTKDAKTFRGMFMEAAFKNNFDLNMLNNSYCYSFVLQHPENRIVVPFKTEQLYLVAAYKIYQNTSEGVVHVLPSDMENVKQMGFWHHTSILFPKIDNNWTSYDELKEKYASMNTSYDVVGIIIKNKVDGTRTKLRNPVYETVRHLRGNHPKLQFQYLCLRKKGAVGDFLSFYPEYKKDCSFFRKCLHDFTETLHKNYISCYVRKEKPLIEFAENYRTHMFHIHRLYLNELMPKKEFVTNTVVIKYVNELDATLQMYSMNYNMRKRNRKDCEM